MATTLHIYGRPDIWPDVIATLKDFSEASKATPTGNQEVFFNAGAQLLRHLPEQLSEGTQSVRWIDLWDLDDHTSQKLALTVSDRVRFCCVRLSQLAEDTNAETLGLYHAGQRLAQRTVAWPMSDHGSPRVLSTRSEYRFRFLLITDLPERLDSILGESAIHQGLDSDSSSELPVFLPIPQAETSWARLPGFRSLFSTMRAPDATPHKVNDINRCMRFPEPQSLICIEAICQPISTVFEFECVCHGLPVGSVIKAFDAWMGQWGSSYLLPSIEPEKVTPNSASYLIATLGMTLPLGMLRDDAWNILYGVADRVEVALKWPIEVTDPYGWADLETSRFTSPPSGISAPAEQVIISRRVELDRAYTEQSLIDAIRPALEKLPAGVYLEIAIPGEVPWYRRF